MTRLVLIDEFLNTLDDVRSFILRGIRFVGTDALGTPPNPAQEVGVAMDRHRLSMASFTLRGHCAPFDRVLFGQPTPYRYAESS
jgi:hypothetical protein